VCRSSNHLAPPSPFRYTSPMSIYGKIHSLPLPPALEAAVERAYAVFPWRGPHGVISVCRCNVCASEEDARLLARTPPRQMTPELLAEYTNSAHSFNDVTEPEFKELLPRYFDLLTKFTPGSHYGDYEYSLRRLRDADYRTRWTHEEVSVVDRFFEAYLPYAAQCIAPDLGFCQHCGKRHYPPSTGLANIITMMVIASYGAERILRIMESDTSPEMSLHLAALILCEVETKDFDNIFSKIFLSDYPQESLAIGDWLLSGETGARLESAFFATADERHQAVISDAMQRCLI
jgi:hypothetical protein